MTAIANTTPTTTWANRMRSKAAAIAKLVAGTRNAVANTADLERDMRVHAIEVERQQRVRGLSAGSYIGMID